MKLTIKPRQVAPAYYDTLKTGQKFTFSPGGAVFTKLGTHQDDPQMYLGDDFQVRRMPELYTVYPHEGPSPRVTIAATDVPVGSVSEYRGTVYVKTSDSGDWVALGSQEPSRSLFPLSNDRVLILNILEIVAEVIND